MAVRLPLLRTCPDITAAEIGQAVHREAVLVTLPQSHSRTMCLASFFGFRDPSRAWTPHHKY